MSNQETIITVLCVINIILMLYLIYKLNAEDYIVYKRPQPNAPRAPSSVTGERGKSFAGSAAAAGFVNTASKVGTV